jgi:alkanesulfonate monooxygenase SsuD/methylene tetrahydromethanopterin reductase-like flavin-dependent oxidoreductase (luciferase family)
MKFGLLYEMQMPEPLDEYQLYQDTMEQVILADELGFDYVWFVEHHFLTSFAYSSAPEVFFGALSQRTRRIRLGFGVALLPYPFNHPVRIAERVAALDLLSGGRVDLGTGRSSVYEQQGFGIDPRETRDMWDEALSMLPGMWTQETFSWQGRYFNVPPRSVIPKPYQKPHPPLWMAGTQPQSFEIAARKGIGVLSMATGVPQRLTKHIDNYRRLIAECEPVGAYVNNQWANFTIAYCDEDDRSARDLGARAIKDYFAADRPYTRDSKDIYAQFIKDWGGDIPDHLQYHTRLQGVAQGDVTGPSGQWKNPKQMFDSFDTDAMCDQGIIIAGDPETCIKGIKLHQEVGVDQMMLCVQTSVIPHQQVMSSLRLFGERVLPAFVPASVRT